MMQKHSVQTAKQQMSNAQIAYTFHAVRAAIPQQNAVGQIAFEQSTESRTQTATMQCTVCNIIVRRMQKNTVHTAMQQISDVQRADMFLANEQTTKHKRMDNRSRTNR